MRLTGGEAGGRRLRGPGGLAIRPTSDRVREALFDILGPRVREALFLDAYAGTGAVGVEALSRGASRVVFLERDRRAVRVIRHNLRSGRWRGEHEILRGDVAHSLLRLRRRGARFQIAFLDPPYAGAIAAAVVTRLARIMAPGGAVIVEHRAPRPPEPLLTSALRPARTYLYGDTALTMLRAAEGGRAP